MEIKQLIGALGGPREKASTPKAPPEAPQRPETAKNDHESNKIKKDYQNH